MVFRGKVLCGKLATTEVSWLLGKRGQEEKEEKSIVPCPQPWLPWLYSTGCENGAFEL